jgi:hypothetical protein
LAHASGLRLVLVLSASVAVGACASPAPRDEPVALVTDDAETANGVCITYYNVGVLIADPEMGTAAQGPGDRPDGNFGIRPLIWPVGYTAHRLAGHEIQVLDAKGDVVATTGRTYQFWTSAWGTAPPGVRSDAVHTGGPGCVNEWKPEG